MKRSNENPCDLLKAAGLGVAVFAILGFAQVEGENKEKDGKNMKPKLFDVRANEVSNEGVPLIKPWKRIVLDPDYVGAWIVAGDLDGDGQAEIVSARNVFDPKLYDAGNEDGGPYTCSVVVHRLDGKVLWRWGNPKIGQNKLSYDVACQIYDWDGDGKNEVVVAEREAIVELDGATGREKRRLAIPRNAADCIVFANISGGERPTDVLVKTRYGQIWAYNYKGELLWTIKNPAGYRTAHQPRPMDIDGDGKDEIMAGYAMLNSDGTIQWDLLGQGLSLDIDRADQNEYTWNDWMRLLKAEQKSLGRIEGHLDCARLFHLGNNPAESSIIFTMCSDDRIAKVDGKGDIIWSVFGHHFESIDIGKVCADVLGKQIVVDIDHQLPGESPLWVLDENGDLLGQIITDGSRHHELIDWFGHGAESIVMATAATMFDGHGKKVAIFDVPDVQMCTKGDLTGDGVPDLILSSNPGSEVYIFKNEKGKKPVGKVGLGTGVNYTLY